MANGQDQDTPKKPDDSAAPQGWVATKLPTGETAYFPDHKTDDEINRHLKYVAPDMSLKPGSIPDQAASKTFDWIWKEKVSKEETAKIWSLTLGGEQTPKTATGKLIVNTLADVTSSMTSPAQIGLTVATLGEWGFGTEAAKEVIPFADTIKGLLKVPGYTSSAVFGLQGLGAMLGDREEGESDTDFMERRIMGAVAFLGTAHLAKTEINEGLGKVLVRSFGLDEDLAAKVSSRVAELEKIRSQRDTSLSSLETERDAKLGNLDLNTRRQVAQFEHQLDDDTKTLGTVAASQSAGINRIADDAIDASKGRLSEMQRDQLHQGSQIISETVQAIREMEGDRDVEGSLKKPFREIGDKIKKPVSDADSIRSLVEGELRERNVNPEEMPAGALKALGKQPKMDTDRLPTDMTRFIGEPPATGGKPVSFNDLTRIREDLYNAAQGATDGAVKGGLMSSYEKVTDLQEKAAEAAGMGKQYLKAKGNYTQFKRGLGSGMMQKWLSAEDVQHQDMQAKVSKLIYADDQKTNGAITRAIRTTLKSAGIDTGPLDDLAKQIAVERDMPKRVVGKYSTLAKADVESERKAGAVTLQKGTKQQIEAAKGLSKERAAALDKDYAERIGAAKEGFKAQEKAADRHKLISGYDTEELAGKGKEELYRIKLQEMADQGKGRLNITPVVMIMYGILHASAFPFLYGMARGGIPAMVKNPAFQDWMIKRSGVALGTPQANQLRRAIAGMGPVLRRMERSGVGQSALMETVHGKEPDRRVSDVPPSREEVTVQP